MKFLNFKNDSQIDKKLKSYNKDINNLLKDQISELKDLTLDQEKFNSLISKLILKMSLDERIDEEKKRDEENENRDKQSKPQNQEHQLKEKDEQHDEMSIDSGVPDLENETKDANKAE